MTTTTIIHIDNLNKYKKEDEDYINIEIDLEGQSKIDPNELSNIIDTDDPNQLSRLKFEAERKHPRIFKDGKYEKYPICCTDTGIIGCGKKNNESDLSPFGLGIINYFKTLKTYCIILIIIIILNIPIYIMYTQSHKEKPILNYQDVIFKTTIGNIASNLNNCIKIPTSEFSFPYLLNPSVTLDCESYVISAINLFGVSPDSYTEIYNDQECQDFSSTQNITISDECSFIGNVTSAAKYCIGNSTSTCDISFDAEAYAKECSGMNDVNYFFLGYTCLDKNLPIGFWEITRDNAAILVVGIDVACILIVIITIIVISRSQKRNAQNYSASINQISDYTINIRNLNLNNKILDQEMNDLLVHLDKIIIDEVPNSKCDDSNYLYDINYPVLNDKKLDLILKKNVVKEKITQIERDLKIHANTYSSQKLEKLEEERTKESEKLVSINDDLINVNDEIEVINDVWITFNKMKYSKNLTLTYHKYNKTERCCLICCCQRKRIDKY